jgi:hypothetical protein
MQELSQWFGPVDVVVEFLTYRSRLNDRSAIRNEFMKMGFDRYYVEGNRIFDSINAGRKMLATALKVLKDHVPSTLSAPPTAALRTIVIYIPGPLTRKYNVVNSALPRELFAKRTRKKSDNGNVCVFAARYSFPDNVTSNPKTLSASFGTLENHAKFTATQSLQARKQMQEMPKWFGPTDVVV